MIHEQHSLGWFRQRLGKITGSRVGDLMKSGKKKDDMFSETAKTYIYKLAGERAMNQAIVNNDELFEMYLEQTSTTSKAMRWGNEQEANARNLYAKKTDRYIIEVGLKQHPTIKNFASSPDGYFYDENTCEKGNLEIKCFEQGKFMRLVDTVKDNETLLKIEPIIFYQCQAHLMCSGSDWCDFILYNPFQKNPINIVRILPDQAVFAEMQKRIEIADEMIEMIVNN